MNKIRVLHFTNIINRHDFIDIIIRNANTDKFQMMASSYRGISNIEDTNYAADGIPFFILNIDHGWINMFRGAWRLSRILKRERIDIIHTHHFYESVVGRLACILHPKTSHVIGRHYHNQFYLTASGFKLKFYLYTENVVNAFAKAIIAPSTQIVELLKKQGVQSSKIKMIPYCFDFNAARYNSISPQQVLSMKKGQGWLGNFIIGNIGRHHIIKGQTYLLKAFKQLKEAIPNCRLVMIGDGPIHHDLVQEANQLGISDSVEFMGWRKDAHTLINCMDVVIHPTLQEAFPQLMIEAMALGKPLLITPVSGATDVIENGVNGFLVPFKDVEGITSAVLKTVANPILTMSLSKRASKYVRENFTIQKIIPRFEKVYEDIAVLK